MGDKSPRQATKINKQKRVAAGAVTTPGKRAASAPGNGSSYSEQMRFRFDRVDIGSAWCLTEISQNDHAELIRFMAEIETKALKELIPDRCKRIDVAGGSRNPAAQQRAREIYRDDHDVIHELHISGAKRLWGLLFDQYFSIIWWDPGHDVFPTRRVYEN